MTARPPSFARPAIEVVDARTNNLRGISVNVPHRQMTVVTGLSGSGKSSLAFDTIYAEGQRRYVETLSTYARQFLQQMRRPPVGAVRNIPPSLALRQGNSVNNARSTVGTVTELADHLQVLFASAGTVVCRSCGTHVRTWNVHDIVAWLRHNAANERVVVLGTVVPEAGDDRSLVLRQLAAEGHRRFLVDQQTIEIDSPEAAVLLTASRWSVVVDRVRVEPDDPRLIEAIEAAARFGEGGVEVVLWDRETDGRRPTRRFPSGWRCAECDTQHHAPVPQLFHTQSQIGSCPTCQGFGRTVGIDEGRVVPDPRKTIEDGAVSCFQTTSYRPWQARLLKACIAAGVPIDVPWLSLAPDARRFVLRGRGRDWLGVDGFFASMEEDRYKPHVRIFLARFRGYTECHACAGSGLSDNARAVRIEGLHLGELLELRIESFFDWINRYAPDAERARALEPLLREIRDRLGFLVEAGVGYLTLARHARTLSGGEMHRVLLATSVGRMLTDTCYVLDEPTAGLHAHDTNRLLGVIERLRDAGNTLVVVEHDPDVIARADHIVEIGPGAGENGGRVVFEGTVAALRDADTITGRSLAVRRLEPVAAPKPSEWLTVRHAVLNNLRDVSASFPVGALSVVTGVSGSGKSTLVNDVLCTKLLEMRGERAAAELGPVSVESPTFGEIVMIDQGSVARSSRSCALTFSGAYTPIRELFAGQPAALAHSISAGDFSFNTPGGRCERCEGSGVIDVEMHFIADIELPCDVCDGRRFKPHVMAVRLNDRSIHDVFEMTVDEAATFFADRAAIARRLEPLQRVGLGYVRLGQSTSRLSGGELQRLKLASFLGVNDNAAAARRLFLFDEPTVGLHMRDVDRLVAAMRELTRNGHTVIVVEHNLDLVSQCDWVVDLGPGAGPSGGTVVYEGPVAGLAGCSTSVTARYLRATFGQCEA